MPNKELIEAIQSGNFRRMNEAASSKFGKPVNVLAFLNSSVSEDITSEGRERHIKTVHEIINKTVSEGNATALADDLEVIYG